MAAKMEDGEVHHHEGEQQPLLVPEPSDGDGMTKVQQAMSQTFRSAAHLANLLPTSTVLAFQVLSPILTNLGRCTDASRIMTACLVALSGLSCFLSSAPFDRPLALDERNSGGEEETEEKKKTRWKEKYDADAF